MNGNNVALRIISALILIAGIAGIGYFAYQAGVAHGSPVTIQAPSGQTQTVPGPYPYPYYGWGVPFFRPWGFGFGFLGCLIPLFLFFIVFGAFRFLLWGPRWGWRRHYGAWGRHWENGVPPMFEEWHKRAHGEAGQPEEKRES